MIISEVHGKYCGDEDDNIDGVDIAAEDDATMRGREIEEKWKKGEVT